MTIGRFQDRVAYITGAGSGVGRATATLLAASGAKVFAVDVDGDAVIETVRTIRSAGGVAFGGVCDVADLDSVEACVEYAAETFGGLHALVNAVSVEGSKRFEEIRAFEWERVVAVNLTGVFHTTKASLPYLTREPAGVIVNVASIDALHGSTSGAHYAAAQGGVVNFTRSIALEVAARGLRANCVVPHSENGAVSAVDDIRVAERIAFLLSEEGRGVNGSVVAVDGTILA